jgi:Na+/phosphate symporter
VKGFLSFNPLAFAHVPPDVTTSNLLMLMFGNCVWHVFTEFMFYFGEELTTIGSVVSVFFHGILNFLISDFRRVLKFVCFL